MGALDPAAGTRSLARHMPLRLSTLCASVLFAFAVGAANAQTVVVNNLVGSSSNPVLNWTRTYKVAQSFTATATGDVDSITLNLTTSNSATTPLYAVELWSTDGQSTPLPSTLLATLVSGQQWSTVYSAAQNPANTVTFTATNFTGNYTLQTGASYWVVVSSTSGSAKAWGVSGTDIGDTATQSTGNVWSAPNLTVSGSPGSLGMSISVQSAVPEPATYAALGGFLGLVVVAVARRRSAPQPRHRA